MEIELKTSFIDLNQYIKCERGKSGRFLASKVKRDHTNRVHNIAKVLRFKVPQGLYIVHFTWMIPNRMKDPDNVAFAKKFILDGLQKAGSITGDGMREISGFTDSFVVDKSYNFTWCKVRFELVK